MIDRFDALAALQRTGTMGSAASALRVTQSAVSKRVAALEREVGVKLVERHGRRVRLTGHAEQLLEQARPLLAGLREVLQSHTPERQTVLRVAATDSLLASWLPATLRTAVERLPALTLELHAHRGPTLVERVRSGDYSIGFCPSVAGDKELIVREVAREAMVIVPARLEPWPLAHADAEVAVWAIEQRSLTWDAVASKLRSLPRKLGFSLRIEGRLESFTALVQIARAGFGHALVPIGVARDLGVPSERLVRLGDLSRPIAVVGRRKAFELAAVKQLLQQLAPLWPR